MIFQGAIGVPAPLDMVSDKFSLNRVIDDLGAIFIQAKDTRNKSMSMLGAVYKGVLPTSEPLLIADGFASIIG